MASTIDRPPDLEALEQEAAARLDDEAGRVEAEIDAAGADGGPEEPDDEPGAGYRIAVAVAFPVVAAAVMVGGVFAGIAPRITAAAAGLLGIGLALVAGRIKKPLVSNLVIVVGLFAVGLLVLIPSAPGEIPRIRSLAASAASSGDVLRPPVDFEVGWQAIVGWLMGIVGFAAVWVATVLRRPALALLVPLPIAAIAGISVPDSAQIASGLVVLVLFAIGLGLLSSAQTLGDGDERPPLAYEVRKAVKALPLLAVITGLLYLLSRTSFLFPPPYIDPAEEPQRPKTTPITEVEDRVLFEVESSVRGPWRLGSLDVYDGRDWRLPPFAENELDDVPDDGVVDRDLLDTRGVRARFTVAGLGGTVLPGVPNTVLVVAEGPKLAYDARNGNIRVAQGQVQAGLSYTVAAAALPEVADLRKVGGDVPEELQQFTEIPDPPPAVQALLDEARSRYDNTWDRFNFLRLHVLDNVVATGTGVPVSITPERAQEILGETEEASPFEIVALQAMLARWAGVPSRIGYGFDGGDVRDDGVLEVRPRNGASFVEVWFSGYKWLPVIGTPKQAQPSVGGDPEQQRTDPNVLPSNDSVVQLFVPQLVPPESTLARQILVIALVVAGILLLVGVVYVLWPAVRKSLLLSRRRAAARAAGPRARVALTYAEWRDHAADFGFLHPTDTPLMFLDRFVDDPEHTELAWLTTRCLWGDLFSSCDDDMAAAAEELSRSLRRRLSARQTAMLRAVAKVSRLSLRHPYAPATDLTVPAQPTRTEPKEERELATVG